MKGRGTKTTFIFVAIALGCAGVTGVAGATTERESVFERIDRLEAERDDAAAIAREGQGTVDEIDDRLVEHESRIDVARRAAGPVFREVARTLTAWTSTMGAIERNGGRSDHRADTRRLLRYAATQSVAPRLTDVDVLRRVESEERAMSSLFMDRVRHTVVLAQNQATADSRAVEKDNLLKKSATDPAVAGEIARADEELRESMSHMLKNETTRDFHRLKGTMIPPVAGAPRFSFGKRAQTSKVSVRHTGYTWYLDAGTEIKATAEGLVVYANRFEGFGNIVIVDHGSGYHTIYAHLESIQTGLGKHVSRGALLGKSGETGSLEGPKFYFELRKEGRAIDPAPWFVRRD